MAYETQVSYPLCADSSFAITVGSVFAACIYPEEDMPENHIELIEMILDGK